MREFCDKLMFFGVFFFRLGGRQVFERWMEWEPEEQAWHSYINFELRYKELDRARMIYERYILPSVQTNYQT